MNTYEIYQHPLRGNAAVKRGFSWPGFLFTFVWALAKQIWLLGGVLLVIAGGLSFVTFELGRNNPVLCGTLWVLFALVTGVKANSWLAWSLEGHGYGFLGLVPARTPAEALAKVTTVGKNWPDEWNQAATPLWFTLVPRSLQQLVAVAGLTYRAAWRFRLLPVLTVLLLSVVIGLPMLLRHDGTARGLTQIIITYSLGIIIFILGLATLWLACGTLAKDVEECQMQVVAVKPVPRWQIWLGKWAGIMTLNALLLGLAGLGVYMLIQIRAASLPPEQKTILQNELLVARASAREAQPDLDKAVEEELRARTQGQDLTGVDLQAVRKEIREQLKAAVQVVPSGFRRRWVLDTQTSAEKLQGRPMQIRVKFNSSRITGSPQPYTTAWEVGPPESNMRQRILKTLTTDTFHEITVDSKQLLPDGKLVVDFLNATEIPLVFPPEECMELLYREGGFGLNLCRGLLILFFWLGVLAALGLTAASFLSFPVASFVALTVLAVCLSSETIATVVKEGSLMGGNVAALQGNFNALDYIFLPLLRVLLNVSKLVLDFSPIDSLSTGRSVTWANLGQAFAQIWLLVGGVLAGLGIALFTRRELATAQSQQ